jgi:multimeric flavodoxin WrbA
MNILAINGSPKKKGGASAFFSKALCFMLFPQKVMVKTIGVSRNYEKIFTDLKNADIVILSVPLYVDGIPSHMIHFLQQMERHCINNKCKFMLYAISNSGFVGGRQNQAHLEQYKCWCERAGITWGGGLGIGGGVMLHVIFYVMLLLGIMQFVVGILINIFSGKPAVDNALLLSFARSMIIWLFFNSGMIFCEFILAQAIKKQRIIKNKYTRAMVPSFIFLIFADIFMALEALFHGKTIFSLYKKHSPYGPMGPPGSL